MDRANPPAANGLAGISIRNGPVDEMEVDKPHTNGVGKRKARNSAVNGLSYKEESDEKEDNAHMVGHLV